MKKLIFSVILMTITWNVFAQETILRKSSKGDLESVEFSADDKSVTVPTSAEIFFKDMLKTKSTDEFRKIQRKQKQKEFVREHFEQYFNGIKIEGAGYNFHYKNGKMFFAHGHYVNTNNIDTKPSIPKPHAMENFARYKNIPIKEIRNYIAELIIKEIPEKIDTLPALVYKVYLFADYPQNTEIGFIDAHTGNLRMTEPAFIDFSATGTFATRYSEAQQGITHNYQGGYHLVDSTRNAIIHTWNLEGRTDFYLPLGTTTAVELIDFDNNWTQVEHRVNNNDIGLDVQWSLQNIYDRLFNTHNINSMDDDGFTINAFIRDGLDPENAFWNPNRQTLSFGVGGSNFRSLASIDVVAHEYGHGISFFQIGWDNTTDQRAFNEGMSDIWGIVMEQRIRPNSVWQIGEQLTINYACLRNIQNTNASDARDKIANTFNSTQYNSGNSYVRGGVFSHWFYLLVNGGTGTNDLGRSYSVRGVGIDIAENLIVKAVYDGYLRFSTSYAQIRTSMINAAREIAGTNSFLEHQIENAWYAVGVGNIQYQYTITGSSQFCTQETYNVNIPTGASISWSASPSYMVSIQQSGSSATLTKLYSGTITLTATISINGQNIVVTKENITVGSPINLVINTISNLWDAGYNNYFKILPANGNYAYQGQLSVVDPSGAAFSYEWSFSSNINRKNTVYWWASGNTVDVAAKTNNAGIILKCTATNSCGSSDAYYTFYTGEISQPPLSLMMSISPNPVTNDVNISIVESTEENTGNFNKEFDISIFNTYGMPVYRKKTKDKNTKVNVSGWQKGFYVVKIISENEIVEDKLYVQ
jgi:Zn-dependent metalloprotease